MSRKNYVYARLGDSCQTDLNELISSTKFFPMDNPEYNLPFTITHQYPGQRYNLFNTVGDIKLPEQLKTQDNKLRAEEDYTSCRSCSRF